MNFQLYSYSLLLILVNIFAVKCWTDDDLELFDLVESTDRKFYDILGVDQKASASDIRKAYRRLSQLYHPDKNKEPDAEERFRKIAAIADVLRNEEQRKKYDVILQTGLPDWREPIYYYRRVRNMGMLDLVIFLFCLTTFAQYLFAWSAYWEKKYEIEEVVLSRMKKKTAKQLRRNKTSKSVEEAEAIAAELDNLPKPRCQDLFPVQLVYLMIHLFQSFPSFMKCAYENSKAIFTSQSVVESEDDSDEEVNERRVRQRGKKHVKPEFPELNTSSDNDGTKLTNGETSLQKSNAVHVNGKSSTGSGIEMNEFRKALKKFPNGTLQRWEKIAEHLQCSVPQVVSLAKQMKAQPYAKSVDISAQGVTGSENCGNSIDAVTISERNEYGDMDNGAQNGENNLSNGTLTLRANGISSHTAVVAVPVNVTEKIWTQDEQKLLEQALTKFPKDTLARWDRISDFVKSKTKEECIIRYKELAQQIKRKKGKEN